MEFTLLYFYWKHNSKIFLFLSMEFTLLYIYWKHNSKIFLFLSYISIGNIILSLCCFVLGVYSSTSLIGNIIQNCNISYDYLVYVLGVYSPTLLIGNIIQNWNITKFILFCSWSLLSYIPNWQQHSKLKIILFLILEFTLPHLHFAMHFNTIIVHCKIIKIILFLFMEFYSLKIQNYNNFTWELWIPRIFHVLGFHTTHEVPTKRVFVHGVSPHRPILRHR